MDAKATLISAPGIAASGCGSNRNRQGTRCATLLALAILIQLVPFRDTEAQRASRYQGEALSRLLERYQGVSIVINPEKDHYIQGQDVALRYRIECASPQPRPWYGFDIENHVELWRDGVRVPHETWSASDFELDREVGASFDGWFRLGSSFEVQTESEFGFWFLPAGRYVGYFDLGVVSPDFEFTVDSAPDSLRTTWLSVCSFQRMFRSPRRVPDARQLLDSVTQAIQPFLLYPANSIWRKEVLRAALNRFAEYRHRWSSEDSVFCETMIAELAHEPEAKGDELCAAAESTLLLGLPEDQAARGLLTLAERLGREDMIRAARNWIAQTNK